MGEVQKGLRVITHSGHFQPDDVFAIATLQILLGDFELIRTRDPEMIKTGDWVVDVGREYDPEKKRFDHHQEGGAGARENGIPYSSFGLVWKHCGVKIAGNEERAGRIEEKLVQQIDAIDNGHMYFTADTVYPYLVDDALSAFNPTWKEEGTYDAQFVRAVTIAKQILEREIIRAQDAIEARDFVEAVYRSADDKRILIFDNNYPTEETLQKYPGVLFVVKPDKANMQWSAYAVREHPNGFKSRKEFPAAWAGKVRAELTEVSGVPDAVFCHNARFVAVAKTKEGAIALAKLALEV